MSTWASPSRRTTRRPNPNRSPTHRPSRPKRSARRWLRSRAASCSALLDIEDARGRLLPAEVILPGMERVRLNIEQEAQVRQGRAVRVLPEPGPGPVRAHDAEGRLVALGHADPLRRTFVPEKVLS